MENKYVRIFMRAQELWRPLATAFLLALLLPVGLFAQERATIVGTVTDSTGAIVPNVKVTITNVGTSVTRAVITNSAGNYSAPELLIGQYSVRAEYQGFKTYERTGIVLNVSDTVRVNIQMQVGNVKEAVSVSAEAVTVQTESAEVSNVVQGQQVTQLAIDGRNFMALAALTPGASANLPSFNLPITTGAANTISFNGNRSDHNLYTIDGTEDYDRGCGGCPTVMPSMDAIAEFKVQTSNYSPDVGLGSSASVNMALKSGTEHFHGTAYEFLRNDALDANDFFANKSGHPKVPLKFNNFGYNIGGPFYIPGKYAKGKTFFFWNEEWRRLRQGTETYAPAIPAAERTGDFSGDLTGVKDANGNDTGAIFVPSPLPGQTLPAGLVAGQPFLGNVIPQSMIDPNAVILASPSLVLPLSNTPDGKFFSAAPSVPTDVREEIIRVNQVLTNKLQLMAHYINDAVDQHTPTTLWSGSTYPTVGSDFINPGKSGVIKLTEMISQTFVNEVSANYNGNRIWINPTGNYAKPSSLGSVGDIFPGNQWNRIPSLYFYGPRFGVGYTTSEYPFSNAFDSFQYRDTANKTVGKHVLTFGGFFLRTHKRTSLFADTQGDFTFNGSYTAAPYAGASPGNEFADFMLGRAYNYTELALNPNAYLRSSSFALYVNDSWRVNSRLTIPVGLRWEYLPHCYDRYNHLANFYPNQFDAAQEQTPAADGTLDPNGPGFQLASAVGATELNSVDPGIRIYMNGIGVAGKNGVPRGLTHNYPNVWEPRLGFAYDLFGDKKTVLRGGYGIYHEKVRDGEVENLTDNPPFTFQASAFNVSLTNTGGAVATNGGIPYFPVSFLADDINYLVPSTQQASFGMERELFPEGILTVEYVGTFSSHLRTERNINQPLMDNPLRGTVSPNFIGPYPGFASIHYGEMSTSANYNSLQVNFRVNSSHGLSFQAAYTWSHALDINSTTQSNPVSNAYDLRADYGNGDLDRRQILIMNYVYDLPFGSGKHFLGGSRGIANQVIGGWQLSGITSFSSGLPFSVMAPGDPAGIGSSVRANLVGNCNAAPRTADAFFNAAAFAPVPTANSVPGATGFGDEGRNVCTGAGRNQWDISLFKNFVPKEGTNLQFRAEFFNTFNHTQFNGYFTGYGSSGFGAASSAFEPRIIEFGLKFSF